MSTQRIEVDELSSWVEDLIATATTDRVLVGIAGSPGSGKSTVAAALAEAVAGSVVVPMDGFHRANADLERLGLRSVKGSPATFDAAAFLAAVHSLRAGDQNVSLPDFDRSLDEPRPDQIVVPSTTRTVIIEGNYLLLDDHPWSELRDLFDGVAHIFLEPEVRVERLVDRHVRFGRLRAEALAFATESDEPNAAAVEAVRHRAHVVVHRSASAEPSDRNANIEQ